MRKVLSIVQIVSGGSGSGGARQAVYVSRGLRDAGHRVVFCAPPGSKALRWALEAGLETHCLSFGGLLKQWLASRRLRRLVGAVGADIVHAHHTKGHNVAILATVGGGFPPVVVNRGVIFDAAFPAKFKTRRVAAVITNSRSAKEVLVRQTVPGDKIHVVYNARPLPDLAELKARVPELRRELAMAEEPGPVVGAVGSGRPEKGFQHLVAAAPRILDAFPSASFVLVGGGMEPLKRQVQALHIAERFRFTGHRRDVLELMGLFDVFVIPSVHMDSCPNVLLEAMGVGVPAIGSAVGGIAEILAGETGGWIIPPGDPDAIAVSAVEMLRRPDRGRELGRQGQERVLKEFTLEHKTARTLDVYRALVGAP